MAGCPKHSFFECVGISWNSSMSRSGTTHKLRIRACPQACRNAANQDRLQALQRAAARRRQIVSHPFDCAQGKLFRKERERMGHPRLKPSNVCYFGMAEAMP